MQSGRNHRNLNDEHHRQRTENRKLEILRPQADNSQIQNLVSKKFGLKAEIALNPRSSLQVNVYSHSVVSFSWPHAA